MADFTPQKLDISKINNGQKFENGDGITADTLNLPIEAVAYMSEKMETISSASVVLVGGEPVETFDADTKVEKVRKTSGNWAYGVEGGKKEERLWQIFRPDGKESFSYDAHIPMYRDGRLSGADPQEEYNYATKKYADTKVASLALDYPTGFGLYGYNEGKDTRIKMYATNGGSSPTNTYLSVPVYVENCISTADPVNEYNCAPKKYVDERVDTKVPSLVGNANIANGDRVYVHIKKADGKDQDESRGLKWNEGGGEPTAHYNGAIPQYSNGYVAVRTPDSSKPFAAANVRYVAQQMRFTPLVLIQADSAGKQFETEVVDAVFDRAISIQYTADGYSREVRSPAYYVENYRDGESVTIFTIPKVKFATDTAGQPEEKDVEVSIYVWYSPKDDGTTGYKAYVTFSEDMRKLYDGNTGLAGTSIEIKLV